MACTQKRTRRYRRPERVLHRTFSEQSGLQSYRFNLGNQCSNLLMLADSSYGPRYVAILSSRSDIESLASDAFVHVLTLRFDAFWIQHVRLPLFRKNRLNDVRRSTKLFGVLLVSWCTRKLRIPCCKKFGISGDDGAFTWCFWGNSLFSVYRCIQKPACRIGIDIPSWCKLSRRDDDYDRNVC